MREFTNSSENSSLINQKEKLTMAIVVAHLGGAVYGAKEGFTVGINSGPITALGCALVGGVAGFLTVRS